MSEIAIDTSTDPQAMLQVYIGQWEGMTRTWFEPDNLADESPWQGRIYPILGDRYIQYDYTGSLQGEPFEGKAIIGYNAMMNQFEMAWIDSFHQSTGIMYCKGHRTSVGFTLWGNYRIAADSADWGWRTDFNLLDAKHLTIRAYNITPDGTESLGVETIYTRR
jgi:hypothetical protein